MSISKNKVAVLLTAAVSELLLVASMLSGFIGSAPSIPVLRYLLLFACSALIIVFALFKTESPRDLFLTLALAVSAAESVYSFIAGFISAANLEISISEDPSILITVIVMGLLALAGMAATILHLVGEHTNAAIIIFSGLKIIYLVFSIIMLLISFAVYNERPGLTVAFYLSLLGNLGMVIQCAALLICGICFHRKRTEPETPAETSETNE